MVLAETLGQAVAQGDGVLLVAGRAARHPAAPGHGAGGVRDSGLVHTVTQAQAVAQALPVTIAVGVRTALSVPVAVHHAASALVAAAFALLAAARGVHVPAGRLGERPGDPRAGIRDWIP